MKNIPAMTASPSRKISNIIRYLLENGAKINALDDYKQTPLNYAAVKGNIEAMTILLNWTGVDLEVKVCFNKTKRDILHNKLFLITSYVLKDLKLQNYQLGLSIKLSLSVNRPRYTSSYCFCT